jgi:hypothetical protein
VAAVGLASGIGEAVGRTLAGESGGYAAIDPATLFALGEAGAWYDPSDLSTVWQDVAGTVPGAVGSPVGRISDKSGNGLHMTSPGLAATFPTLRQDANGKRYIERDGSDDYMESAASLTLQEGFTIAYAGQFAAGAGSGTSAIAALSLNATNYLLCGFRQDVGGARAAARADSTADALVTASGASGAFAAAVNASVISTLRASTITVSVNGGADASTALATDYGPVAACKLRLGTQAGVALTIATRCYSLIAVNRALTASEKGGVVAYQRQKAGA